MSNDSIINHASERFGSYSVQSTIYETDAYVLYTAVSENNEPVFLELLLSDSAGLQAEFAKRVLILEQLASPGVPPILETGQTGQKRPFVVYGPRTDDGRLLTDRVAASEKGLPELQSLQIAHQISETLTAVHEKGLIHIDLHPEQIWLTPEKQVWLLGLAIPHQTALRAIESSSTQTSYASPEQIAGSDLQPESNLYSLGVIAYTMLAGRPPAYREAEWDIFAQGGQEPSIIPLEEVKPGLAPETYRLVRQCMGRHTWSRYEQAADLTWALSHAIEQTMAPTNEPRKIAVPSTVTSNQRTWLLVGVGLLLLLLIGGGIALAGRGGETPELEDAETAVLVVADPTESAADPTALPTQTAIPAETTLLQPPNDAEISSQDQVTFAWLWPEALREGEAFLLQVKAGDEIVYEATVDEAVGNARFEHETAVGDIVAESDAYSWQVLLTTTNGVRYRSENGRFIVIVTPPTRTPEPLATATATNTPEPTETPEPTAEPTSEACVPTQPAGWVVYTYQLDDVLFNLAIETGTTVAEIERVSCISATSLSVGQQIFLPFSPIPDTPTPAPTAPPQDNGGGGSGGNGGGGGGNPPPPPPPATPTPPGLP